MSHAMPFPQATGATSLGRSVAVLEMSALANTYRSSFRELAAGLLTMPCSAPENLRSCLQLNAYALLR